MSNNPRIRLQNPVRRKFLRSVSFCVFASEDISRYNSYFHCGLSFDIPKEASMF